MTALIPREPEMPILSLADMNTITMVVFGPKLAVPRCDAIFVFGGIHPGHWLTTIQAFRHNLGDLIIVTGGQSRTAGVGYQEKVGQNMESELIVDKLLREGIPSDQIIMEQKSANSLENVEYAKELIDFNKFKKLLFITKSHVVGRHWRTLQKHLPANIELYPYSFVTDYNGVFVSRDNWMDSSIGRSRVWGEYLRIYEYGKKGDLVALNSDEIITTLTNKK